MTSARFTRLFRMGVKDLMLHKTRALLTTLGVVFGVSSVIAMLSVGEGASRQALAQISRLGSHNIILTSQKAAEDEQAGAQQRSQVAIYGLLYEDNHRIAASIPSVKRTVPARLIRTEGWYRDRKLDMRIVGTTPDWFDLVARPILAGRVLSARDAAASTPVCVLTEHGARRLLAGTGILGESISMNSVHFTVIGIVKNEGANSAVQTPDQEVDAYVPLSVCLERFGELNIILDSGSRSMELVELHQLIVEVRETDAVRPTAKAITAMLRRFHKREDYKVSVPLELLRQAETTRRTFNVVLGSIAGISLLVGGIGIMNIMLASVTERTREIGIRRAIGAKRSHIALQFLVETSVLSGLGGLIGVAMGLLIPMVITRFTAMPTATPLWSLFLSFGISVGIGIVFGLYPAIAASQLDPIEALRHE
ncbi:MAG: ABC transporter permease [Kiritimatiellia bacterium]